jgi:hypothetical protein
LVYISPFDIVETRKFENKWEEYRYGKWRKGSGKTFVTLETVIPEVPKNKIEAPDEAAFHKRQTEIQNKIKDMFKELGDQTEKFSTIVEQKRATNKGQSALESGNIKTKLNRLSELNRMRQEILDNCSKFDEEKLELQRKKD